MQVAPAPTLPPVSETLVPPGAAVTVPTPQVVAALGDAATVTLAGRVSVTDSALSAIAPGPVFATEIVRRVIPSGAIVCGANVLLSVTLCVSTVSVAAAAFVFVVPCALVTEPTGMTFTCVPVVLPVTCTLTVHVAAAPRFPPLKTIVDPPGLAATAPPHVVVAFGAAATSTPLGSVSVTPSAVSATAPSCVFAIEMVSSEVPSIAMDAGENALLSVTPGAIAVSVAVAGTVLVAPCAFVTAPAGMVLTNVPVRTAVTLTVTVHVAPTAICAPDRTTVPVPGSA